MSTVTLSGKQIREQGRIRTWNGKCGYGHIITPSGTVYFVHISEFKKMGPINEELLKPGAVVNFTYVLGASVGEKDSPRAYDATLEGQ